MNEITPLNSIIEQTFFDQNLHFDECSLSGGDKLLFGNLSISRVCHLAIPI